MNRNRTGIIIILLAVLFVATIIAAFLDVKQSVDLYHSVNELHASGSGSEAVAETEEAYRSFTMLRVASAGIVTEILLIALLLVTYAGPQIHKMRPVTQAEARRMAKQFKKEYKIDGIYAEAPQDNAEIEDKSQITSLDTPALVSAKHTKFCVTVKWKKVQHADFYQIFRMSGTESYKRIGKVLDSENSVFEDYNIDSNTTYTYTVKAYVDVEENRIWSKYDPSGVSAHVVQGNIPPAPTIYAAKDEDGIECLGWDVVPKVKVYLVYRKDENGNWIPLEKVFSTENCTYVDSKALPGETYCYTVRPARAINWNWIWGPFNEEGITITKQQEA